MAGEQPIGNLTAIFKQIAQQGLKVVLATNNSTKTVEQYLEKLLRFGVKLEQWQIVTSSLAAANYLERLYPEGGPVYVVGEAGLVSALRNKGFCPLESSQEGDVLAVVAGLDRGLTYEKLRTAAKFVQNGALFIGTNNDHTLPTPEGQIPGAGAILAALQTATKQQPVIIGKPEPEMYRWAIELMGIQPEDTLVVGDRLETDIAGAQALGCMTGLVLSGVATKEQASQWFPAPDKLAMDLTTLLAEL
jgi:4-nitrophenyl phosphatase